MKTCVVKLSGELVYSLVADEQLIIHKRISSLTKLPDLLYKQGVDRLVFICQAMPITVKTEDSVKVTSLRLQNSDIPFVIKDTDQMFFSELATSLNIKEVEIVSYTKYIENKFKSDGELIVVDTYLDGYAVMYLSEGRILDFTKSSSINLPRKIGKFKDLYKAPVVNVYNRLESVGIRASIRNYKRIPKDQLFSLDYLPFCLECTGNSLVKDFSSGEDFLRDVEEEIKDNNTNVKDSEKDLQIEDLIPSQTNKKSSGIFRNFFKVSVDLNPDRVTHLDRIIDVFLTAGSIAFIVTCVLGVLFTVFYRDEIKELTTYKNTYLDKSDSIKKLEEYLSGNKEESPANSLQKVYNSVGNQNIANCRYQNGEFSVTTITKSDSDRKDVESKIPRGFEIAGKNSLGTIKQGDILLDKTRYVLSTSPS